MLQERVSWDHIINECGLDELVRFAYGQTSKRQFSRFGRNCRRITDMIENESLRESAQRAVRHRTNARQRRLALS